MPDLIGYARVSTIHQDLDSQIADLRKFGCNGKIFAESDSGGNRLRPELAKCFDYLRPGDTLVIHHLEKLHSKTSSFLHVW